MARNKHPEETVQRILTTASKLFLEKGYEKTSLQDIIRETGLSKGAIYHHFSSKEEILAWLLQRLLRDLSNDIGHIVDRDDAARDRLSAVITAYLQLFADHRDLCTVLLTELGRITRIPLLADAIWAAFHEPVRKLLDAGEHDGSLRAVEEEMSASAEELSQIAGELQAEVGRFRTGEADGEAASARALPMPRFVDLRARTGALV